MSRLLGDAVDLVVWYESQTDSGTYHVDERIAVELGWFKAGKGGFKTEARAVRPHQRRNAQADGDAARVRRARRYVDKNNAFQPFIGYSFGTKRNGAGRRFSMLYTPNRDHTVKALNETTSEQLGRVVQQSSQAASERARMVSHLAQSEYEYIEAGKFAEAMVIHDAVKELETFGQITMTTLQSARSLGVLGIMQAGAS